MREAGLALLLLACGCAQARAGAWTQDKGHWQIISSFDLAGASKGFDAQSRARAPIKFDKRFTKSLLEYGWTDSLTFILAPEYSVAVSTWSKTAPVQALDLGVEGGARLRLSDSFGIVSLQATLKYAGPFDLSHGPIQEFRGVVRGSAASAEIRVLYGTGFKLFGRDGFADLELGQRFRSPPLPNETAFDATAGLWLGTRAMVMAQSFNEVSGGDAEPPYTYFRMHKLELSLVRRLSDRWSLQLGGYISPAGQNSLVEQGLTISLWHQG